MSKSTEEISRKIREQASSRRGKQWSHADRLTNAYLLLELARTIIREYLHDAADELGDIAAEVLETAREREQSDIHADDTDEESPQERHDAHEPDNSEDDTAWDDDNWEIPAGQPGSPY